MSRFLPYFAAKSIARDMDARGEVPGLALRLLILIPSTVLIVGGGAIMAFMVVDFTLWELGLIP